MNSKFSYNTLSGMQKVNESLKINCHNKGQLKNYWEML